MSYIGSWNAVISELKARAEATDENKDVLAHFKMMMNGNDVVDVEMELTYGYDETANDIFHTMGKGSEALMTPHDVFHHPATSESFEYEDFGNGIVRVPIHTMINGMNVFSFAISRPPKSVEQFLADYNIDRNADIDYYFIHQANKMIVDRVVKKLKLPQEKCPYNLEEFGNLGGASIPSLMVTRKTDKLRTE